MGDLPIWWVPKHDTELVAAVLEHGHGNWAPAFLDPQYSFRAAAIAHEAEVRAVGGSACETASSSSGL